MAFNQGLFRSQASGTKARAKRVAVGAASLTLSTLKTALGSKFPSVAIPPSSFPEPSSLVGTIKQPVVPSPDVTVSEVAASEMLDALEERGNASVALAKRRALAVASDRLPSLRALKGFSKLSPSNTGGIVPSTAGSALTAGRAAAAQVEAISRGVAAPAPVVPEEVTATRTRATDAWRGILGL